MIETTKTMTATYEKAAVCSTYELADSRLGIGIIMSMSAMLGIWGTTCIISGLTSAGNINELGRGIVTALIGI